MFWHHPDFRMWHALVGATVLVVIVAIVANLLRGDSGGKT
jgi:hypothetical protein